MESLDKFLAETHPKGHSRKISNDHKAYLASLYPSYPLKFQIWYYRNGYKSEPRCEVCGGVLKKVDAKTCSMACREALHASTGGRMASREKAKATCLARYGVENPAQSKDTQEKRIASLVKKHGAKVSDKTRMATKDRAGELNRKGRQSLMERHGVINPGQMKDHRKKCLSTFTAKTGVNHFTKTAEYQQAQVERKQAKWQRIADGIVDILSIDRATITGYENPNDRITFKCKACDQEETLPTETFKWRVNQGLTPCASCSGITRGSLAENEISGFLRQYTTVEQHRRDIISPLEIDMLLPEHGIAIEYNGLFWHNDLRVDQKYHLTKTERCAQIGVRLVHIFEDEWLFQKDIVKSRLMGMIGMNQKIHARKCSVIEITPTQANSFLNSNHLQGAGRANMHLGLVLGDNLVAVMTFLHGDLSKRISGWELNRYCSLNGTNVVGGASKLLSYFVKKYNPKKITSFADRRWSALDPFYSKLGFVFSHNSRPNYWYFRLNEMTRKHRYGFRSTKEMSEKDRVAKENLLRIWDCGSSKWIWSQK